MNARSVADRVTLWLFCALAFWVIYWLAMGLPKGSRTMPTAPAPQVRLKPGCHVTATGVEGGKQWTKIECEPAAP